ncbi:MAG: hypothetical protein ACTINX_08355, partial [Leuconostoc falkenbergense]
YLGLCPRNKAVRIFSIRADILGANVNAVSYAYATEIENKPVKTATRAIPDYEAKLAAAQKKYDEARAAANQGGGGKAANMAAASAAQSAKDELNKLKATGGYEYEDKVLKDEKGVPLPGKLKAEEKTSNDGKIIYSYRNNKWVYSHLVSGQAAYAAKHMVEKNDLQKIKDMCATVTLHDNYYFQTCWEHNEDLSKDSNWDVAFESLMSKSDVDCLNTNATLRHRGGINSILANTVTRKVNDIEMLGFKGLGVKNRIIGDKDYNFTGKNASLWYAPTFNIGLGYYENNQHVDPSDKQKTVYQDFCYKNTDAFFNDDGSYNSGQQAYNEKSYDRGDVTFIRLVKDGDNNLDVLNNGKKTPVAPDHFVE